MLVVKVFFFKVVTPLSMTVTVLAEVNITLTLVAVVNNSDTSEYELRYFFYGVGSESIFLKGCNDEKYDNDGVDKSKNASDDNGRRLK